MKTQDEIAAEIVIAGSSREPVLALLEQYRRAIERVAARAERERLREAVQALRVYEEDWDDVYVSDPRALYRSDVLALLAEPPE